MAVCSNCGKTVGNTSYCPHCGTKLMRSGWGECDRWESNQKSSADRSPVYAGRFQGDDRSQKRPNYNGYIAEDGRYTPFLYQPPSSAPIVSLVLGIISLIAWLLPLLGYPISIIGLVLGAKNAGRAGYAKAGMIVSIFGLCLTLLNSFLGWLIFSL